MRPLPVLGISNLSVAFKGGPVQRLGVVGESGSSPVVVRVLAPGTGFIHAMVLDAALRGPPTFQAPGCGRGCGSRNSACSSPR